MTKENEEKMHFQKVTLDNYFTTQEERDSEHLEKIKIIPRNKIFPFPNHPFKVNDDKKMFEMVDSIKEYGVLVPLLIRPRADGNYEMVAGHRRQRACELARINDMPCIIRNLTDEQATIIMVDSNLQREQILPSERAFAYKMRLEAMNKQGKRTDLTLTPTVSKLRSNEELAEQVGESREQIRRYIRLTELIPEILKLVDEEKMKLRPAVEISYLKKEQQEYLLETIDYTQAFPSHPQARKMKKLNDEGKLTEDEIDDIMSEEKANQIPKLKLSEDRFSKVLPPNLKTAKEKEDYIFHCVEETRKRELKQKEYVR